MHAPENTIAATSGTAVLDADVGSVLAELMAPAERLTPNPDTTLPLEGVAILTRHRHRHRYGVAPFETD